ncbi:hypothetical protein TI03_04990 [Achromatium sp. WMS1]|nr:hypothetical protein TI03_04990 [Achromatium sp. WMS1]
MKSIHHFVGLLVLAVCSNVANTAVTVVINGTRYNYADTPRLEEVLAPVALNQPWYWPVSRLYRVDKATVEQKRTDVLSWINRLRRERQDDGQMQLALAQVHEHITNWQLAQFIPIQIDYDQARLHRNKNPRFTQGTYILNLAPRRNTLYVSGLVAKEAVVAAPNSSQCSGHYFNDMDKLSVANRDFVFVVQPDGVIKTLNIAYWNRECHTIMLGSQMIVPFKYELFSSELDQLNLAIVKLATYRIIN